MFAKWLMDAGGITDKTLRQEQAIMSWHGIEGHDTVVEQFRRSIAAGRLGSTFLFVGPEGVGKRTFARKLAASLLCEKVLAGQRAPLDACGTCPACTQVEAGSHPDLESISKPADKSAIPLELLIGDKAHRMREGLCARIAMKPACGGRKLALIDDADYLNQEGANCLLKTLEEPPPGSILILIGTSPERQLPTIRSRSQIVRFQPLPIAVLEKLLLAQQATIHDAVRAKMIASMAGGSLSEAAKWNDDALWEFRESLLETLATIDWSSQQLAKRTSEFVDAAGKEAPKRRERQRMVIDIVAGYYRQLMRQSVGGPSTGDRRLDECVLRRLQADAIDVEVIATCVERTGLARQHVDVNANQSTNLDAWLDELSQILRKRLVACLL